MIELYQAERVAMLQGCTEFRAEILCMAHRWSRSPAGGPACGASRQSLDRLL